MCDSPTGLLVFAMKGLSLLAPRMQFTPEQIITFANLAWLPGPEYAMRFWAHCAANEEAKNKERKPVNNKPRVAITVFLGGDDDAAGDGSTAQEVGEGAIRLEQPFKPDTSAAYTCPAWARTRYNVLFSQRVSGKPGLLAWERPEVILSGIRGLAKEVSKIDQRLDPVREQAAEPLESIVVDEQAAAQAPGGGLKPPDRPILEQGDSSTTQVASQPPSSPKGKESETMLSAPAEDDSKRQDGSITDTPRPGTPDTIVLVTAPSEEEFAKP